MKNNLKMPLKMVMVAVSCQAMLYAEIAKPAPSVAEQKASFVRSLPNIAGNLAEKAKIAIKTAYDNYQHAYAQAIAGREDFAEVLKAQSYVEYGMMAQQVLSQNKELAALAAIGMVVLTTVARKYAVVAPAGPQNAPLAPAPQK